MKIKIIVCLLLAINIILVSCQAENGSAVNSVIPNDSSAVSMAVSSIASSQLTVESRQTDTAEIAVGTDGIKRLDVKMLLGASNLFEIRMIDEENAYILGISNNQKNSPEGFLVWENILAKVNLNTGEICDILQGYYSSDGRDNMLAQRLPDGSEMVYNGQSVFHIVGNQLNEECPLEGNLKREASFHAPSNTLAYVDENTLNLSLYRMDIGKTAVLFESVKNQGGKVTQRPTRPYFSADGEKVLFQRVGETNLQYESVVGCDVNGKVLFETDKLKRLSDVVYAAWLKEGFYTMQATDQSVDTPFGQATYFAIYDQSGAAKNRFMLASAVAGIQRSPYNSTALAVRMLEPDSVLRYTLGVVNLLSGKANIVYHSKGIITSQEISPSGKLLVWIEDNVICTMVLENAKQEAVSVKSWEG